MSLVREISVSLQLPEKFILNTAARASHLYRSYRVPKRTQGSRLIHHPSPELKALQRWLLIQVVSNWRVHESCWSYRRSWTILDNAKVHAPFPYLLRMDLAEFFPSITATDLTNFLATKPLGTSNWGEGDIELFTKLVCYQGRLTIGAPSSPGISNAICWSLDDRLAELARRNDLVYSRYADDLFFSSAVTNVLRDIPVAVEEILSTLEWPSALVVNAEKTRHLSRKRKRTVTGIVLTSDGRAVIARDTKRKLRALIHRFEMLNPGERLRVRGLFWYVVSLEPDFYNAMILKYGSRAVRQMAGK